MTGNSGPLHRSQTLLAQLVVLQGYRRLEGASGGEIAMDEDVRKKGVLYIQQQRFGKKWKKVWSIIYRESACSISRMEFFECKDNAVSMEKADKTLRKQENKKVIKLSDCIRVSEVEMDCPKDCGPFLVETTEKLFVFAAENSELEDWTQKLCEIAFPMNWSERVVPKRSSIQRGPTRGDPEESTMEENSLYCRGDHALRDFKVLVRKTEASERCRLRGSFFLRADFDSLILIDSKSGEMLFAWPYRYLRRFGRDKVTFSFEAGRRCDTGEGNFEFDTKQGNGLFQAVETAINMQKNTYAPQRQASGGMDMEPAPRHPITKDSCVYSTISEAQMRDSPAPLQGARSRLDLPSDKLLTGVKSLTLDTRPPPRKNQVKTISSCPLLNSEDQAYSHTSMTRDQGEPEEAKPTSAAHGRQGSHDEYSLPFDTISKNLMACFLAAQTPLAGDAGNERDNRADGAEAPDPIYDSIDEMSVRPVLKTQSQVRKPTEFKVEHIYDEPEGCAAMVTEVRGPTSLYDEPEEVKGYAWKFQGTAVDPSGHEYPYNPHIDDYAVPKPAKRAFPDLQEDQSKEDDDSPYDNVMSKMTSRGNR
ncbi:docking protein 2 [Anguilla rostrata]|uniref:docking protein 2 n=1 Tax=Anguilla rostrata TaxID=7938 RepID=UPI0030CDA424